MINDTLLLEVGVDPVPRVLVGNKTDLGTRVVSTEEGKALAAKWGCRYVEVSARLNDNVKGAFQGLLEDMEKDSGLLAEKEKPMCTLL